MKCDICKEKEAFIHVKQIAGNNVSELHLCVECATLKGFLPEDDETEFSISQLLTTLLDMNGKTIERDESYVCPDCGTDIGEFRKNLRLGCAECYNFFANDLEGLFKIPSGYIHHVGKLPQKIGTLKKLILDKEVLKDKLKKAVSEEDYELAAVLRDRLKNIEKHTGENNGSTT